MGRAVGSIGPFPKCAATLILIRRRNASFFVKTPGLTPVPLSRQVAINMNVERGFDGTRRKNPFWGREIHAARRPRLLQRARIVTALRALVRGTGFRRDRTRGVAGLAGQRDAYFRLRHAVLAPRRRVRPPLYLHSSPEFDCKKLLAAGEKRIFALAHVFRNGERSKLHHPEFTMLEWYRAETPYRALIDDCAAMLRRAAEAAGVDAVPLRRGQPRPLCRARNPDRGRGVRASCRDRPVGHLEREGTRSRGARRAS